MENGRRQKQRFVVMRRQWFALLLVVTFAIMFAVAGKRFHSAIEILGFSAVGAVVVTSLVSLASVPVIWIMSRNQKNEK